MYKHNLGKFAVAIDNWFEKRKSELWICPILKADKWPNIRLFYSGD